MPIKIGINGFGRIGKLVFRLAVGTPEIEVVQANDKMDIKLMVHLLKYDSLHGQFDAEISQDKSHIMVNGKKVLVTHHSAPSLIPWKKKGVEIVVESSGLFRDRIHLEGHLLNGAKKVILGCPALDDSIDRTVVMGINHQQILPTDLIISNSSCTTNCVAMMLKVLKEKFGLRRAFMNTVHPFTNSQNLQDGMHTDFRRARGALNNIIPTTTSAIEIIPLVLPEMKNIFDGFATRVPVADCSFVELTALLGTKVTVPEVNSAFKEYAHDQLRDYLEYGADPIVSSDVNNNLHSAVFDSLVTKVLLHDLIQIIAWYDNESGYAARIIDLIKYIASL